MLTSPRRVAPFYTVVVTLITLGHPLLLSLIQPLGAEAPQGPPAAAAGALPAEIPIFPLPEVALFPGVARPFLIYEPRYREMIADALKGDRIIGTVLLRPGFEKNYEGRPPIYSVGCAGVITHADPQPDGRFNIVLRGLVKYRILTEDETKSAAEREE